MNEADKLFDPNKILSHIDRLRISLSDLTVAPVEVDLSISNVCNHRRFFCCDLRQHQIKHLNMPESHIVWVMQELARVGVKAVTLEGGGEPARGHLVCALDHMALTPRPFSTPFRGLCTPSAPKPIPRLAPTPLLICSPFSRLWGILESPGRLHGPPPLPSPEPTVCSLTAPRAGRAAAGQRRPGGGRDEMPYAPEVELKRKPSLVHWIDGEGYLKLIGPDCVCLGEDGFCKIYEHRPAECRAYPLYPKGDQVVVHANCPDALSFCYRLADGDEEAVRFYEKALALFLGMSQDQLDHLDRYVSTWKFWPEHVIEPEPFFRELGAYDIRVYENRERIN